MITVEFAKRADARTVSGELHNRSEFNLVADILSPLGAERVSERGELITKSYAPATVVHANLRADRAVVTFRNVKTRTYYVKDYREFGGLAVFIKWVASPQQSRWLRELFWSMKETQWAHERLFVKAGFQVPRKLAKISDRQAGLLVFASEYLEGFRPLNLLSGDRKRRCIKNCVDKLHRLVEMDVFPAMLRSEELVCPESHDQPLITDTSAGVWPTFRSLLPLMIGMRQANVLAGLQIDSILSRNYFARTSWRKETKVLRNFLRNLSRSQRKVVFHSAIDAWMENNAAGTWKTAELTLAYEEDFLLRNFPGSKVADRLRNGERLPL